jgi:hypothetical protein
MVAHHHRYDIRLRVVRDRPLDRAPTLRTPPIRSGPLGVLVPPYVPYPLALAPSYPLTLVPSICAMSLSAK